MGLPQHSESDLPAPPKPTAQPTPPPTTLHPDSSTAAPPQSVSSLPPAALDLAAKLFDLARDGSTNDLSQYLQAGVPPNLTNAKGDTLLMLAAYHGHVETVKMLLRRGADPNVLNDRGQSIIAGAVFKGYDEVVEVLYHGGGDEERRADVRVGQPSAVDSAKMFKREAYLELFGVEDDTSRPWEGAA